MSVFYIMNGFVLLFIVAVWVVERIWAPLRDPVVTERVMLALIAGSTAQLGTLAVSVGRNLWRADA